LSTRYDLLGQCQCEYNAVFKNVDRQYVLR